MYLQDTSGKFWCCGDNQSGNLANGNTTQTTSWISLSPPSGTTIKNLFIGDANNHSIFCSVNENNKIYAVGNNMSGQLGIGNEVNQSTWQDVSSINLSLSGNEVVVNIYTSGQNYSGPGGVTPWAYWNGTFNSRTSSQSV